ncbi:hypothetical protein [Anaerovorax sp. IOR16]|uniref:hypothetical protein n=1 Tax=Anaerovorax sp. IOR16 TaxID=2773458 RepID=UPI0019D2F914|nr:hypothetical protein [Anaerovorax sp. IOR16]
MNDIKKAIDALKVLSSVSLSWFGTAATEEQRNVLENDINSLDLAIEALQEKSERENPKALTLEQLREREGKPVYVVYFSSSCSIKKPSEWLVLKLCNPTVDYPFVVFEGERLNAMYYCRGWIAYDHEPKEGERNE